MSKQTEIPLQYACRVQSISRGICAIITTFFETLSEYKNKRVTVLKYDSLHYVLWLIILVWYLLFLLPDDLPIRVGLLLVITMLECLLSGIVIHLAALNCLFCGHIDTNCGDMKTIASCHW